MLIIRSAGGHKTLRTVLRVFTSQKWCRWNWCVALPIQHCSWTKRGITVVHRSDLFCNGRRVAGVRRGAGLGLLKKPLYRALLADLDHKGRGFVRCCQVAGVIG